MQQHKTNMINEEWNKTQNDAPFVTFYDMRAVMFVLPDEMANVSIVGLQWFILIPRLNHTGSHRLIIPITRTKKKTTVTATLHRDLQTVTSSFSIIFSVPMYQSLQQITFIFHTLCLYSEFYLR